jgi:two-component system nitrate/nitrite response regulator NarL
MMSACIPDSRVVVLGESEEGETLVEALEAGARGYLSKESPVEELIEGIRAVYRGGTAITATMVGYLVDRLLRRRREQDDARRRVYQLSPREREVLALLVRGGDNDGIAQALVISPQTARTHIQNMLPKLGVHSRLEAAAFVARHGLIDELAPAS